EYVSFVQTQTAKETLDQMKEIAPDAETIYYTYVLNEDKKLVGVLSLRDLIVADEDKLIVEIMNDNVVSVSVGKDQEEVAKMIDRKSTRLNSSHVSISYAVFCLNKKIY